MSSIEPVKVGNLKGIKIEEILLDCEKHNVPGDLFIRVLSHVPGYAENLYNAMKQSFYIGNVSHKLKELIRIQLSYRSEDIYSQNLRSKLAQQEGLTEEDINSACGDFENCQRFNDDEKWALRFSYLMYRDPEKIDSVFYENGKKFFTEAQIMEIGSFVALHYGLQVFMRTINLGLVQENLQ